MSEHDLSQSIVDAARECGWLVYRTWRSIHSPAGFPDLVLAKPPHLIFAELKSEKGKVSEKQQEWIDTLGRIANVRVYVWRPADLEDVYKMLVKGE